MSTGSDNAHHIMGSLETQLLRWLVNQTASDDGHLTKDGRGVKTPPGLVLTTVRSFPPVNPHKFFHHCCSFFVPPPFVIISSSSVRYLGTARAIFFVCSIGHLSSDELLDSTYRCTYNGR